MLRKISRRNYEIWLRWSSVLVSAFGKRTIRELEERLTKLKKQADEEKGADALVDELLGGGEKDKSRQEINCVGRSTTARLRAALWSARGWCPEFLYKHDAQASVFTSRDPTHSRGLRARIIKGNDAVDLDGGLAPCRY